MRRIAKSGLLILAIAACLLGVLFAPKESAPERKSKTQVVPVKNPQPRRGIWLRV